MNSYLKFALVGCCSLLYGQAMAQHEADSVVEKKLRLSFYTGFVSEDFQWSIAGNSQGQNPNIFSELKWRKLRGPYFNLNSEWNFWKAFIAKGEFGYAPIVSGHVTDRDYEGDNRTLNIYDASLDSDEGHLSIANGEAGYRVINKKTVVLKMFAGYSYQRQYLYLLDHSGSFDKTLKSTYQTSWYGPSLSVNTAVRLHNRISFAVNLKYYQLTYRARADWNLIEDFKHPDSFKHHAKGHGVEPSAQLAYRISRRFNIFVAEAYTTWKTGRGVDTLYLADGQLRQTRLNGVTRTQHLITAGVHCAF